MLIEIASEIHAFKGTPKLITISNKYKHEFLDEILDFTKYHDDFRNRLLGSMIFGIDVQFIDLDDIGLTFLIE